MKKKVTISDIALEAGVSVATVSRLLSGKGPVADSTRAKLQELIHKYSYDTRLLSRGFRKERTKTIGCIVQQLAHPYFVQACAAFEQATRDAGLAMLLGVSTDRWETEEKVIQLFLEKKVDALVLMGGTTNWSDPPSRFKAVIAGAVEQCPVAFVNGYYEAEGVVQVRTDEVGAFVALLERVRAAGHTRIAYIGGDPVSGAAIVRKKTFRDWALEHGIELKPHWLLETGYSIHHGIDAMRELLSWKDLPTAVVCCNDVVAAGAINTIQERGYKVPADLSIVGFDGIELSDYPFPPLTTAAQDFLKLAQTAIALLERAQNETIPPQTVTVAARQVEGTTLGPPRSYRSPIERP